MAAPRSTVLTILATGVLLVTGTACTTHLSSGSNSMRRVDALLVAGMNQEALAAIDRLHRARKIDPSLVAESMLARARALEGVGRRSEAIAHYRFVADHHPRTIWARTAQDWLSRSAVEASAAASPQADRSTAVPAAISVDADSEPSASSDAAGDGGSFDLAEWGFLTEVEVQIPGMQYPERAVRREIEGVVEVAFQVEKDGRVQRIAILNDPHPLLVSEVIRAIAAAEIDPVMLGLADRSSFPVKRRTKVSFFLKN